MKRLSDCESEYDYRMFKIEKLPGDLIVDDINNYMNRIKNDISYSEPRPWCYNGESTSPRWEHCDIPTCNKSKFWEDLMLDLFILKLE